MKNRSWIWAWMAGAFFLLQGSPLYAFNQKELDKLRSTGECVGCDLSYADLRKANLANANLSWSNLRGAKLSGANLRGALLEKATLESAELKGTDFTRANLSRVNAAQASFSGALLEETNLIDARLEGADLSWSNMQGAMLKGAILTGGSLQGADLSGANLTGVDLTAVDTKKARLDSATLPEKEKAKQAGGQTALAAKDTPRPSARSSVKSAGKIALPAAVAEDKAAPPKGLAILRGIQSSAQADEFHLTVLMDNVIPESKTFYLKSPPRLVIDLFGQWKKVGFPVQLVKNDIVDNIRVGRYPDKIRLALNLKDAAPKRTKIRKFPGGIILAVTNLEKKAATQGAATDHPVSFEEKELASAPDEVKDALQAIEAAKKEAKAGKETGKRTVFSLVPSYGNGSFRLLFELDGPVQYVRPFVLQNPDRIFLDLPGRWQAPTPAPVVPDNPLVQNLRIGSSWEKLRIVLDMKTGRFQQPLLSMDGKRLEVVIESGNTSVEAVQPKQASFAAVAPPPAALPAVPAPVVAVPAAAAPEKEAPARSQVIRPLFDMKATKEGSKIRLELFADGPITNARSFSLASPARHVLDLPGTWRRVGVIPPAELPPGPVNKVRLNLLQDKLRITLDMKSPPPYGTEIRETSSGLVLLISR